LLVLGTPGARAQQAPGSTSTNAVNESAETRHARELTLRARERFDAGDYTAALAEYNRAYELLAGDARRAALLNNIAVCHERLFQYDLALQAYERYLREGATDPADRTEVEAVIRGLRDLLGKLHITSNVRAEVWLEGRMLGYAAGNFQVPSGSRVVELRASGYQASRRTLQVAARVLTSAHFELEVLPSYHGIDRAYFWSGVALTCAALVTGGALGIGALGRYHDNEHLWRRELLPANAARQRAARRLALGSDVSFGAAALFAVSTTVLAFLTDFRREQQVRHKVGKAQMQLAPQAAAGHLEVTLVGAFR
jgi:hypothetical protein